MMKEIAAEKRRVVNLRDATFDEDIEGETGTGILQLNPHAESAVGFYIYRMAPGASSTPHHHLGVEEFYVIDGELTDHDGVTYRTGDVVWLDGGTEHYSTSATGCTVAVFSEKGEKAPEAS